VPSVLTIIVEGRELNLFARKYVNVYKVYLKQCSEEVQRRFVWIAYDDQC
jgi:hypothetical protein